MPVRLHLNHQPVDATLGASVFDCAETLGVKVPTSCRKQGKCKECIVEVTSGAEYLSAPGPEEKHLQENFRLSSRACVTA